MIIGKLCFGKDDFTYGLELCLNKAGRTAYSVTEKTVMGCDLLLVTAFWFYDAYHLKAFYDKAGLSLDSKDRPKILIGGMQATMSPEIFSHMADWVFIGDGDDYLKAILDDIEAGKEPESPYLYTRHMDTIPQPAECMPSAFKISKGGKRDVTRIEIARGCKYKCPFCAISNLKPYREVRYEDVVPLLNNVRGPISLFAPERTIHTEWAKYKAHIKDKGLRDLGQDARLERITDIEHASVTVGIEGISERLRKTIHKPFTDDFIVDQFRSFVESRRGIGMISAYFIADLPGENEDDWAAIWNLFERLEKEQFTRRMTFKPVLNPLSPKRYTKLNNAIVRPFVDYETQWISLLRRGGSSQWGFRLVETLVWGPWERMMDVLVNKGGHKSWDVISRLPAKLITSKPPKSERRKLATMLLKECRNVGLTDELLGIAV